MILRADIPNEVRKLSFFAEQLPTQAITYLSEQGWQAFFSTRITTYYASDRVIGNPEIKSVEKLIQSK